MYVRFDPLHMYLCQSVPFSLPLKEIIMYHHALSCRGMDIHDHLLSDRLIQLQWTTCIMWQFSWVDCSVWFYWFQSMVGWLFSASNDVNSKIIFTTYCMYFSTNDAHRCQGNTGYWLLKRKLVRVCLSLIHSSDWVCFSMRPEEPVVVLSHFNSIYELCRQWNSQCASRKVVDWGFIKEQE